MERNIAVIQKKKQQRQLTGMDVDTIRLIGQHLRRMGFQSTLQNLMDESGCALEHPKAAKFRSHVIAGEWQQADSALSDLVPLLEDPTNVDKMRLLLLTEKYLELLERGNELEALHCLRHELAPLPLHHSDKHIQVLTSYMMYPDKGELCRAASWPGVKGGAREKLMDKLQAFLPASVMLPPKRLQQLLTQALQQQVERCPFHYIEQNITDYSLLTDHICSRSHFPSEPVHVLTDHSDEVWYLKFSHDGTRLASGSRDGQITVWNVSDVRLKKEHVLKGQNDGIAFLAWSPDDSLLLSCGREDSPEALVFSTQSGEIKCRIQNSAEDSLTCCAWNNDGRRFYVGGTRGQFMECSLDGAVTTSWEGVRVHAVATHPKSNLVYAADTHCRIRQYNFQEKSSSTLVHEDHPIMSFTLSRNGRHALLNIATQGVHVWDLQDRCLVHRYQGVTQGLYTIHSSYGGINDSFITSGSEDHHVYVWHHRRETPVIVLKGHSRAVNCVAWNPAHHDMLASASDDGTVRLWGTEEQMRVQQRLREAEAREQAAQETLQDGDASESVESVDDMRGSQQALETEGEGEGEGMEVQHLESSETESQSLDIEGERAEGSSSSLSSERLEETSSTVSVTISEGGAAERTEPSSSAEPYSQQATQAEASSAQYVGESIELLQTTLQLRESSVDPQDSHRSADSSNGSTRQADLSSQSEDFEDGHGVVRLSSLSSSSESASRTSVVVERGHPPGSGSGEGASSSSGGRQAQQQQEEQGDGTSRYSPTTGASISTVV